MNAMPKIVGAMLLAAAAALGGVQFAFAADLPILTLAEPSHNLGYLPLYVAQRKGFFEAAGVNVVTMMITGGSTATDATLTGQTFASIGSADHDALAKAKGKDLKAVVNVVARGNIYLTARAGVDTSGDLASVLKGRRFITGPYGGTPNAVSRFLMKKLGLDVEKDVQLKEGGEAAILPSMASGNADIATSWEPILTQGITAGVWQEPFLAIPDYLGPYAYSVVSVRDETIKDHPEQVQALVNGIVAGLRFVYEHPDEAFTIAQQEFPSMPEADMKATMARTFKDKLWSEDGNVPKEAWDTAKAVAMNAGTLTTDIGYDDIFDMEFVKATTTAK